MDEKSEAQLKNEAEVRRIMDERGYSSAASKKEVRKKLGGGFSFKPIIVGAVVVAVGVGIVWFAVSRWLGGQENEPVSSMVDSETGQELAEFRECLGAVDQSEVMLDDAEFWEKYISRYEQMVACYDKYPVVASASEKADLEKKLGELRENSQNENAGAIEYRQSEAESERAYQEALARNQAEYERKKAELDAETAKKLEEYDRQREERSAQYAKEQAERERQQSEKEARAAAEAQAKQARCDEYKAIYGEASASELAEADAEVVRAKYNWTEAQKKIRSCTGGNAVYNQTQRETCNAYRDAEVQTAESYHTTYMNLLQSKTTYYMKMRANACGY